MAFHCADFVVEFVSSCSESMFEELEEDAEEGSCKSMMSLLSSGFEMVSQLKLPLSLEIWSDDFDLVFAAGGIVEVLILAGAASQKTTDSLFLDASSQLE